MTEDSSSHRPTKRIHVYSETSRRADLEFFCMGLRGFVWVEDGISG